MKVNILAVFVTLISVMQLSAEERWAVLVGIDQYAKTEINPLRGSVNDCLALRDVLVRYARFPSDNVFCLTSNDPENMPDFGNIIIKLDYVASKAKSGDAFVFFFSGHGISREGKSYLLTYESDLRNEEFIERTTLSVEKLRKKLGEIGAGKVILVLDACRNNPQTGRGDKDNVLTEEFAKGIRIAPKSKESGEVQVSATMYSCEVGKRAYEWPNKNRGFFSVAFEEALTGRADNNDGEVTLNEIETYLHKRVPDLVKSQMGMDMMQMPWVDRTGAGAGDWVVSWRGKTVQATASPEEARPAPELKPVDVGEVQKQEVIENLLPTTASGKPPVIEITTYPTKPLNRLEAKLITVRFKAEDDRGIKNYRYRLNNEKPKETIRGFVDLKDLVTGRHTFQVQAQDVEGNLSEPVKAEITVLANVRPVAKIESPGVNATVKGKELNVTIGGEDKDGKIAKYRCAIDVPDDFKESEKNKFVYDEIADGSHTIYGQVIDNDGEGSVWVSGRLNYYFTGGGVGVQPDVTEEIKMSDMDDGKIVVKPTPPEAVVYLDGEYQGQGLKIFRNLKRFIKHQIMLQHPDFKYTFVSVSADNLVYVPGGTFTQSDGSSSFSHTVSSFYIGKYEVTYQLWKEVYQWAVSNGYSFANAGNGTGSKPVTAINWRDCIVWCNAYSEKVGLTAVYYANAEFNLPIKDSRDGSYRNTINTSAGSNDDPYVDWNASGYRLPTEGEWEYSARYKDGSSWTPSNYASGATADYNNATATGEVVWYDGNSGNMTHDVGTKEANALGIYDMSGNVWEWCWDLYGDYPYTSKKNYRGPIGGAGRVRRGGSYMISIAHDVQVGYRNYDYPFVEGGNIGFRLVRGR